jgi:hypothetical protein
MDHEHVERLARIVLVFAGAFVSGWTLRGRGTSADRFARALVPLPPLGGWAVLLASGSMILTALFLTGGRLARTPRLPDQPLSRP